MPKLTGSLAPEGALVEVVVGCSASHAWSLRAALRPVPPAEPTRALLDTGAEVSGIDAGFARTLGLPVASFVLVNMPAHGGVSYSPVYDASLAVAHPSGDPGQNLVVLDLPLVELPLNVLGYQALLGRDLLARCSFLYSGRTNRFRLSY